MVSSPPSAAENDEECIELWLKGLSELTIEAYRRDTSSFRAFVGKKLASVTLADICRWDDAIAHLAPATRQRRLSAVKSLFGFALRIGHVASNMAAPVRTPKVRNRLSERILCEDEVQRMIALEPDARNYLILRLGYGCGLRRAEICGLTWGDTRATAAGGQLTVLGKGQKTRFVTVSPNLWKRLIDLRQDFGGSEPIFRSREGGHLSTSQLHNIIKAAAARAGLNEKVSPNWLRHAHASHALDHGAPVHVVQQSLGHASLTTTTRYVHMRPGDGSGNYLPD